MLKQRSEKLSNERKVQNVGHKGHSTKGVDIAQLLGRSFTGFK